MSEKELGKILLILAGYCLFFSPVLDILLTGHLLKKSTRRDAAFLPLCSYFVYLPILFLAYLADPDPKPYTRMSNYFSLGIGLFMFSSRIFVGLIMHYTKRHTHQAGPLAKQNEVESTLEIEGVRCPKCRFDLRANIDVLKCPECGHFLGEAFWQWHRRSARKDGVYKFRRNGLRVLWNACLSVVLLFPLWHGLMLSSVPVVKTRFQIYTLETENPNYTIRIFHYRNQHVWFFWRVADGGWTEADVRWRGHRSETRRFLQVDLKEDLFYLSVPRAYKPMSDDLSDLEKIDQWLDGETPPKSLVDELLEEYPNENLGDYLERPQLTEGQLSAMLGLILGGWDEESVVGTEFTMMRKSFTEPTINWRRYRGNKILDILLFLLVMPLLWYWIIRAYDGSLLWAIRQSSILIWAIVLLVFNGLWQILFLYFFPGG